MDLQKVQAKFTSGSRRWSEKMRMEEEEKWSVALKSDSGSFLRQKPSRRGRRRKSSSTGRRPPIRGGLFLEGRRRRGAKQIEKRSTERKREYQRRSGEMPPDRRSSGKQKRLHALLHLICPGVLSTAGSVSLTLGPPCWPLYLHLIPPSLPQAPPPLLSAARLTRTPLSGEG